MEVHGRFSANDCQNPSSMLLDLKVESEMEIAPQMKSGPA